jgi:pimeloyl-ACP methyl ester carboxylesterase
MSAPSLRYTDPGRQNRLVWRTRESGLGRVGSVAYRHRMARSSRSFDPELTQYRYPRAVGFYEFRGQDQDLRKGYRVLAPDQIGFGKSSKPDAAALSLVDAGTAARSPGPTR